MPVDRTDDICALRAEQVGEPLAGTATHTVGWLLIEQPGAWGSDTLVASGLDPEVAVALSRWQSRPPGNVRVQLLRRPRSLVARADANTRTTGPAGHTSPRRVAYLVHAGEQAWIRRFIIERDTDLLHLPLAATTGPQAPTSGEPVNASLLLVCTHGSRDRCCAQFGRPVAEALCGLTQQDGPGSDVEIWETSHVGGHRWAANVAVLPDGLLYGRLAPDDLAELVAATRQSRVLVDRLRGRCALPAPAQAAEIFARRHLSDERSPVRVVDVLVDESCDGWRVALAVGDRPLQVRVTQRPVDGTVLASCAPAGAEPSFEQTNRWVLVGIDAATGANASV